MNESKLTHAQIELLQYILNKHMFDTCTMHSKEHTALKYKLITMRAELEYPHSDLHLSPEDVVNTI
jgi:hypothetical protein